MESLLREAHVCLADGNIAPHLLRCLAHLVLFLRRVGRITQPLEPLCTDILEACVKVSQIFLIKPAVGVSKYAANTNDLNI